MASVIGYDTVHPFAQVNISDRDSVQQLLRTLLDPLHPFFSPNKGRIRCPGGTAVRFDQTASEVEGFCRPLWGLASLLAGGGTYSDADMWIQGLKAGSDPASPDFWGVPRDNDQRMVEMCPLGFTLAVAPQFWEQLSSKERANVEEWLGNSINEKRMPNTNWLWFRVFANLGLKQNGGRYSQERLDSDIIHLDTFYRGDGWSNDGPEGIHQMDYYSSSFAIHFLQLLYAKLAGHDDPDKATEFKKRAQIAALDLMYYYDEEGAAIPFGRSVGYRFAMVAFWGALAYADVDLPPPLTWGMVKRMVLQNLRWWQTQRDMWTGNGTLSLGFSYPTMYMLENYNSPGSPYWACLAFICLAVPETHPFWRSAEEPHSTVLSPVRVIKQPGHILSNRAGHYMILSSGQACGYPMKATHAKYGAFAYSSFFGYSVPSGLFTLEQYALASQLGLSDDNGEYWKTRRVCEYAGIEERGGNPVLVSRWKPFPDVEIKTILVPPAEDTPRWHLRIHKIKAGREVMTADGAFAICNANSTNGRALDSYNPETCEGTTPKIIGNYDTQSAEGWASGRDGAFGVSKGAVGIKALETMDGRRAMLVNADPNTNLMHSRTTIPTLQHTITKGEVVIYVTAIYAATKGPRREYLDGWDAPPALPSWLDGES